MANQPQEKEWAGMLLYLQKLEAQMLCHAALEGSCDQVRNHASGLLNKCLQNQQNLFSIMNQKGWYKVDSAPQELYNSAQQKFTAMQTQM
ncbi:MAG: spore coat protein [Thermacetogeniaceae bacterium]|jgi:spore coat protein CotF